AAAARDLAARLLRPLPGHGAHRAAPLRAAAGGDAMSALLLALFLQATPASPAPSASPAVESATPAPDHAAASKAPAAEHAAPAVATTATSPEAHAGEPAHEGAAAEHEEGPAEIIFHHVMDGPMFGGVVTSKHLFYLIAVAILVISLSQLAVRSYQGGR